MGFSLKKITKKVSNGFKNILSSPVGGFVDAFVGSNFYGSSQQAKQNELAFQQQRQLINEQNLYNSPQSQMQRYSQAGLNPNLIYGQISSGNQSNIAEPSTYSAGNNRLLSSVGRNLRNIYYQNANLDIQNKRLANEALHLDNENKRLDNDSKRLYLLEGIQPYRLEQLKQQNALNSLNLEKNKYFGGNNFISSMLYSLFKNSERASDYVTSPQGSQRVLNFIKKYMFFNKI